MSGTKKKERSQRWAQRRKQEHEKDEGRNNCGNMREGKKKEVEIEEFVAAGRKETSLDTRRAAAGGPTAALGVSPVSP